ncbi:hypothetical protein TWF481_000698 [Arthrobotrys musiformis]|uniref:Uncharacterized protein n=1 Tax=Arthrobotrys musiformis TaxID=47236 RepID=A0AAV9WND7_9PEZI
MSFRSEQYFIYGSDSFTERPISRSAYEDRSLGPKQIWLLPEGTRGLVPWNIVKSDFGYIFQSRGAPTGEAEGAVVAILNENWDPYIQWIVEPVPNDQNLFRYCRPLLLVLYSYDVASTETFIYRALEFGHGIGNTGQWKNKEAALATEDKGQGAQNFRIVRANLNPNEEGYEFSHYSTNYSERHGFGKGLDADPQSHCDYGKRQKEFRS